ncbi:uncharacterized protein LOC128786232 [Vidua chalybeata]|uniref:uncharacterized protein LOC128786232 n=1 Tax=Vidua chalybeata TaxID=81927 RepID=UPI0023A7DB6A|nr:uncharacterized protein LOC128786232 [Vidua chalybeata]XP_053795341.1 uncharacterized protein LOC128786232 [Vidua chalybeata]
MWMQQVAPCGVGGVQITMFYSIPCRDHNPCALESRNSSFWQEKVPRKSPAVTICRGTMRHPNGESPICQEVFGGDPGQKTTKWTLDSRDASEPSAWSSEMKGRHPLMCLPFTQCVCGESTGALLQHLPPLLITQELLLGGRQLFLDVEESRNAVNARHQSFCCRLQALLVWAQFSKVLCKLSGFIEVTLWAGAMLCHPPSLAGWLLASPSQPSLSCKVAISSTVRRAPCEQQALSMLPHSLQCKGGPRALPMDFPPTGATTLLEGSSQPCFELLPCKCILSSTHLPDPGQSNLWPQGVKHGLEN